MRVSKEEYTEAKSPFIDRILASGELAKENRP